MLQNACWLTAGKLVQLLINFLVGIWLARYLGPGEYGLLSYGAAYTGAVTCLCNLGIPSILVKELTDAPEQEGEILGTALVLQGISSLVWMVVILWIAYQAEGKNPAVMGIVGLSSLGMLLRTLDNFRFWFQARQKCYVTSAAAVLACTAAGLYKILLLWQRKTVVWFAFSTGVEYACLGLLLLRMYWKNRGCPLTCSLERGKQLLRQSCYFILPGLMVAVYGQADRFLLKLLKNGQELGWYATAVSLSSAWCFVLSALIDATYPEIARVYGKDQPAFNRRNRKLYRAVFYLSAAVSLLIACLAASAIDFLYGESYRGAVRPLQILTWSTGFSYLGVARNAWIVCENRQKYLLGVYAAGALCNVLLNLLLIPRWGAVGAAIASLLSQGVTALAAPLCIKGLRQNGKLMLEAIFGKGVM